APRSSGRRRGEDVAHHEGGGRHGSQDAGARRLCCGAGIAQGHSMMRITNAGRHFGGAGCLAAALLIGVASAGAATSEGAAAAMRGDRQAVRAALARKADVNAAQVDGTTALHWAVERDDVELAELLLTAGASVSARTREGVLPLQLAAINGNAAMLGRLIRSG